MSTISIGVDLAKSVFSVCAMDGAGHVLRPQDPRREAFGIWLAQLVAPFRKGRRTKNDLADAEAIATRPRMRRVDRLGGSSASR